MAASESGDKSPTENLSDVAQLVKAYAMQETLEPLKGLGRYLAFGIAGSLMLGVGLIFLALAGLRGLQTVEDLRGGWLIFVPYLVVIIVAAIVLGLIATRITKGLDDE